MGDQIAAIALDTTGSSVIPVGEETGAARRILSLVRSPRLGRGGADHSGRTSQEKLEAIDWCGGVYSSEWGFSKLLHWLRHNPEKRAGWSPRSSTATWWRRRCAASPIRIRCSAASAPWATNGCGTSRSAGFRSEISSVKVDPLLAGVRRKARRRVSHLRPDRRTSLAGVGREAWAYGRHSDSGGRIRRALGCDRRRLRHRRRGERGRHLHLHHGDQRRLSALIPGVCGVVQGSVHPELHRHRSGPVGDRRYLRCHRDARRTRLWLSCRRA